jgi:hypothetical protein
MENEGGQEPISLLLLAVNYRAWSQTQGLHEENWSRDRTYIVGGKNGDAE